MEFTKEELKDLFISVLLISFILSFPNLQNFLLYLIIVVIAFLFHELAHKFVARKFGCAAFYKIWYPGILFALFVTLISYGNFKFISPGAVVIYPYTFGRWGFRVISLTVSEMGIIAFAGPATNLFFAIIFSLLPGEIARIIAFTNAWLALFNLLPIKPLDGSKIILWKPWVWLFTFVISIVMVLLLW